jgi:hypothetical protein
MQKKKKIKFFNLIINPVAHESYTLPYQILIVQRFMIGSKIKEPPPTKILEESKPRKSAAVIVVSYGTNFVHF